MIKTATIYCLIDPTDKQVRYIGKSIDVKARYKAHLCIRKKTSYSRNWIKSLKDKNLLPILEIIDVVPYKKWKYWEKHYIKIFKRIGCDLTNHQKGGGAGNDFSKFSEETKLKMRLAQLGKKHSPETRQKQRIAKLGRKLTPEHIEKVRQSQLGKKQPLDAIAKTVKAKEKSVIQFDLITGEKIAEYESARKAKDALNGKGFNLTNHLKGNRKSYMGYRFEYKNKE